MIGPAGTVDLHVTSTQREAAVGREGRCTALFDQWLNAVSLPLSMHFSRHALLI